MNVFKVASSVSLPILIETYTSIRLSGHKNHLTACPICGNGHRTGCFGLYGKEKHILDRYKCFSCGSNGNGIDLVMKIKGFATALDAAKDICDTFGLEYDTLPINEDYKIYTDVLNYCAKLFNHYYKCSINPNLNYFKDRGISDKICDEYLLGYCPLTFSVDGKYKSLKDILSVKFPGIKLDDLDLGIYNSFGDCIFADRYIFPIKDFKGNVVAFSGRSLSPTVSKYINSKETKFFKKKFSLYNLDKAKSYATVYVVEGYMDALSLIESGIPNVVASMGTAFGNTHLSLLKDKQVILSLDSDDAGQTAMASLIESNKDRKLKVLSLNKYKDFNEALTSGLNIKEFISKCKTITSPEYLIRFLVNRLSLKTLDDRRELWIRLSKLIGADSIKFQSAFPINLIYTPVEFDYYWTIVARLVKGKRGK